VILLAGLAGCGAEPIGPNYAYAPPPAYGYGTWLGADYCCGTSLVRPVHFHQDQGAMADTTTNAWLAAVEINLACGQRRAGQKLEQPRQDLDYREEHGVHEPGRNRDARADALRVSWRFAVQAGTALIEMTRVIDALDPHLTALDADIVQGGGLCIGRH
jgi:hypothetical protein